MARQIESKQHHESIGKRTNWRRWRGVKTTASVERLLRPSAQTHTSGFGEQTGRSIKPKASSPTAPSPAFHAATCDFLITCASDKKYKEHFSEYSHSKLTRCSTQTLELVRPTTNKTLVLGKSANKMQFAQIDLSRLFSFRSFTKFLNNYTQPFEE